MAHYLSFRPTWTSEKSSIKQYFLFLDLKVPDASAMPCYVSWSSLAQIWSLWRYFWTQGLPNGVLSNRPCLSVCLSVRPSVLLSFKYLREGSLVFLKLWLKLGVNKVKKVTWPKFSKKILIQGLRGV